MFGKGEVYLPQLLIDVQRLKQMEQVEQPKIHPPPIQPTYITLKHYSSWPCDKVFELQKSTSI